MKRKRGRPKGSKNKDAPLHQEAIVAHDRPQESLPPLVDLPSLPMAENALATRIESDNTIKSVAKELFSSEDVDLKTDVTQNQIVDLSRLKFLHERYNTKNVDMLFDTFLRLRVSKDRRSRQEFVECNQLEKKNAQGINWGGLLGMNQGGQP